jgi:dihydropyrimidinase
MSFPSEFDLVVTNGVCATSADVAPLDIGIKDEKIVLLAPSGSLSQAKALRVIDAEGGYVMVSRSGLWKKKKAELTI